MQYNDLNQKYSAMLEELLSVLNQAGGQALQGEVKVDSGEAAAEVTPEFTAGHEFPLLRLKFSTTGQSAYDHQFLMDRSLAGLVYSWMVGGDPPEEIGDEHLDAVKEAVGQIIGQLQAAFDGEDGAFTPGEVAISQLASADELALPEGGLVATYSFSRGDDDTKHLITHIIQGELADQEDEAAPAEEAAEAEAGEGAEDVPEAETEAAIAEGAEDAPEAETEAAIAEGAEDAPEAETEAVIAEGAEDAPEAEDATGVDDLLADDFGEEVPATILEDTSAEEPGETADELTDLAAETAGIDDIFGEDLDEPVGAGEPSPVEASPVQFDEFGPSRKTDGQGRQIDMLLDVELDVTVELGRKIMLVEEILRLGKGSVVELDKLAGEPVDILVNGKKLAEGEVVVVEDHFGVRLTNLINPRERIRSLGKA